MWVRCEESGCGSIGASHVQVVNASVVCRSSVCRNCRNDAITYHDDGSGLHRQSFEGHNAEASSSGRAGLEPIIEMQCALRDGFLKVHIGDRREPPLQFGEFKVVRGHQAESVSSASAVMRARPPISRSRLFVPLKTSSINQSTGGRPVRSGVVEDPSVV